MIAMVDPVPYNSNMLKDTLWFFWLLALEKSQFAIIRILQSKPDLQYNNKFVTVSGKTRRVANFMKF